MLVHNKGKYVRHRGTVRVLPGVNDIKEKDWNHFKSHPLNAELVKSGEIFELGGESDSEKSEQDYVKITDLNADEAIDMVADTFSLDLLNEFKADEQADKNRKTVLEAVDTQIKELTEAPEGDQEGGE